MRKPRRSGAPGGRAARRRPAGRRAGMRREAQAQRRRQKADRPALLFRSPAPTPGSTPALAGRVVPGVSPGLSWLARASRAARKRAPEGPEAARRGGRDRRESPGHGELWAALCHAMWRTIRPACRGAGMSDKLALSDMIRKPAPNPMPNAAKPGREPLLARPRGRSGGDL